MKTQEISLNVKTDYPVVREYVGSSIAASLGIHASVFALIALLALLFHVKSLADFMSASTVPPPPPDQEIQVILPPDETPPPPTDHPEWVHQIIKPPDLPPPPPPPKVKPPPPKPVPIVQHVAPKPAPTTQSSVGMGHLPEPSYPPSLLHAGIHGTVVLSVSFDASGRAYEADVVSSSGSAQLDNYTRHFVLSNWREPYFAGQTRNAPFDYNIKN